ncbi:MAG: asparagine synthase (glutamine-hydrolyzing) [Candidatus Scalindua sp.]
MCGIVGIVGSNEEPTLKKMLGAMKHRGPDDDGMFTVPDKLAIGMVRLSIIDLATGHQPLGNEDGSIQVVCNGEIYNYLELRNELKTKGHVFKTDSDTEAIVHAYEEFGDDCVVKFNGMFAFALWDSKKSQLMLARDRLGIKPLYYAFHNNNIYFASEINAILTIPEFKRQLNLNSLHNYFGGMVAIGEETAFHDIYRFPPAHIAWIKDGKLHKKRYWNLQFLPKNDKSEDELCEEFQALFDDAVRIQLRSDVPLGVFLSGGIDSAAVAERAIHHLGKLKTFSLGFLEEDDGEVPNELEYARKTADYLGTEHYEFKLEGDMVRKHSKETIESFGDLYSGPTPQYFIAELARKHVKVVLSGLGGDELFGNYDRPRRFEHNMGKSSLFLFRCLDRNEVIEKIFKKCFKNTPGKLGQIIRRSISPGEVYSNRAEAIFKKKQRESILNRDIISQLDNEMRCEAIYQDMFNDVYSFPLADKIMAIDLKTQLVDEYLAYADRFTMAHSLEARVPFLDHRLVEWAAALPVEKRYRNGDPKYLLKRALQKYLPEETFQRPKMGFSLPYGKWLEGPMSSLIDEYLSPHYLSKQQIFNSQTVHSIVKDFRMGKRGSIVFQLWSLIVFQMWHDIYFNQPHYVYNKTTTSSHRS